MKLTEEQEYYLLMGGNPFTAVWHIWVTGFVIFAFTVCISSCNQPKVINDDDRKYELIFTMGIIGYIHHCDRYVKNGNVYLLYKDNKLSETIDAGGSMVTIEVK